MKTLLSSSMDLVTFSFLFSSPSGPDHYRISLSYLLDHFPRVALIHPDLFRLRKVKILGPGMATVADRLYTRAAPLLVFSTVRDALTSQQCLCLGNGNIVNRDPMVVDYCGLSLLYLHALNVCQSLTSQRDFKMSYRFLHQQWSLPTSHRCNVGLIWFSDWVQPVHYCCQRITVFVTIDMIDSC